MTELIQYLEQTDASIFLALNGWHCAFFDHFMMMYSGRFVWLPFYAAFLYVMLRNYPLKSTLTCLLVITLIVTLCDQTASGLLKPMIQRLRPSNLDNPISPMVHIVDGYRGGSYGFPSSHAANAWGVAFYAMYLARRTRLTLFLLGWALLMGYTRIYLGVHYVGDVLVGTLIGLLVATIAYVLYSRLLPNCAQVFRPTPSPLRAAVLPIAAGVATIAIMLIVSCVMCCL